MTLELWKNHLEALVRASLLAMLVAAIGLLFQGCRTTPLRKEIDALVWKNTGLPLSLCGSSREDSPNPLLWDSGIYRTLDTGGYDFIPYCVRSEMDEHASEVRRFLSVRDDDYARMLDTYIPEKKKASPGSE